MTLQTRSVKISGAPSQRGWSQSFEYPPDSKNLPGIDFLAIVFSTIKSSDEINDTRVARELLQEFHETFRLGSVKTVDNRLRDGVKKVFNDFFQKLDGLEISAGCFVEGKMYVASINGGKALLYRDRFLVKILDSTSPKLVSASGFSKKGDAMFLTTSDFLRGVDSSEIIDIYSDGLNAAKESFAAKFREVPTASAAIVSFGDENDLVAEPQKIQEDDTTQTVEQPRVQSRRLRFNLFDRLKSIAPRRTLFLNQRENDFRPRNNKLIFVGIVLTILLGVSVFFGVYKNKQDAYKGTYSERLNFVKTNIDDALRLKNVDTAHSRELFLQANQVLDQLVSEGIKDPEIDTLKKTISDNKSEILGEKDVTPQLWLDLSLIVDNFSASQVVDDGKFLYLPDFSKNSVISVNLDGKRSSTIKIPDGVGATSIVSGANEIYLLGNDGVYTLSKKEKVLDKNWSGNPLLGSFGANLYFLDLQNGEILKSSGTDSGFADAKKWTTSDSEDFSSVRSFVVDGFAWVLNDNAQISKYSYGNKLSFQLKDYPYDLPKYDKLVTDSNTENLYLLDRADKKISVYDKTGEYQYNLNADVLGDVKDFLVYESDKRIILLTGEKLYELKY